MTITGLEDNNYLSGNDIWIKIGGFAMQTERLQLKVTNMKSLQSLPVFTLYPSLNNDYQFNICLPVRALFPAPEHLADPSNNIQEFLLHFVVFLKNEPAKSVLLNKYFIRGGVERNNAKNWFLNDGEELIIGAWVKWQGVSFDFLPQRINGGRIEYYSTPTKTKTLVIKNKCQYKLIKFLNSKGGYQYWIFEHFEIKTQTKAEKFIPKIQHHLQHDNFRNLGVSSEKKITLYTRTPTELQPIIIDLIQSMEVFMYNENGTNNESKWQRLVIEDNNALENSFDQVFENKITFSFSNQITTAL